MCAVPMKARRGRRSPGTRVVDNHESLARSQCSYPLNQFSSPRKSLFWSRVCEVSAHSDREERVDSSSRHGYQEQREAAQVAHFCVPPLIVSGSPAYG